MEAPNHGSAAEMEGSSSPPLPSSSSSSSAASSKDGPVLNLMNKRLRALKKKYNKILQIEESKSQGKSINKEQEDVLKSKSSVSVLMDEYEKLRQPLAMALKEELAEREQELLAHMNIHAHTTEEITKEAEEGNVSIVMNEKDVVRKANEEEEDRKLNGGGDLEEIEVGKVRFLRVKKEDDDEEEAKEEEEEEKERNSCFLMDEKVTVRKMDSLTSNAEEGKSDSALDRQMDSVIDRIVSEIVTCVYFAQLFDVRSQAEKSHLFWTKVHERSSCLSYDYVTEDTMSPLTEADLDDLSFFGLMITSRAPNATLSHKDALHQCISHAKLWLHSSDSVIQDSLGLSYSHLKERLNRILSSEYYTMTPELQIASQQAAATMAMQYGSRIFIHEASSNDGVMELKGGISSFYPQQQNVGADQHTLYHNENIFSGQSKPTLVAPSGTTNEGGQDGTAFESYHISEVVRQEEVTSSEDDAPQQEESREPEKQQLDEHVPNIRVGPRGYQAFRSDGKGYNNYGAGGRARGRGYRHGGKGNEGGGGGQYYNQRAYQPRNYYVRNGRGARDGNSAYDES